MDYDLDYTLRINTEPKSNLYRWAINEVTADGQPINRDQIPWGWTLMFSATSCSLTNRFEIERRFSEGEYTPQIETDQVIRMTLRPGVMRDGEIVHKVKFSMFGTNRPIRLFTLEVRPLDDSEKIESCNAWGSVSYTSEIDFRTCTTDDCLEFYLNVRPEIFMQYVSLISQGAIDTVLFSAGPVEGFYSDWSPSISTNNVKVLVVGEEHKLDLPPNFQGEPPRLGKVHGARLLLHRSLELGKGSPSPPPAINHSAELPPPANSALQVTSEMDPRLLPVLASLKQAAWVAVALLAAIAVIAHQKH